METIKKYVKSALTPIVFFAFITTVVIWYHMIRINKLEKDITVLNEKISGVCDLGIKTVEGLENNQNGLVEAFYEIHKLKQMLKQEKTIYH